MRALPAIIPFVFAVAPAQVAHGALVDTSGGCDRYDFCDYVTQVRAAPGEVNHLSVTDVNGAPVFSDPGVELTAGRRCTNVDAHVVTCLPDVVRVKVLAGEGDDRIDASGYSAGPVTIDGGPGDDVITGGPSRDWLRGGPGRDRVSGGPGSDWVSFGGTRGATVVNLRRQEARVSGHTEYFAGIENAAGGAGDDVLIGNAGANQLSGGPGDDDLRGGRGPDHLLGGPGTDTLRGGPGEDTLANVGYLTPREANPEDIGCGAGLDTVEPADAPYVIRGDCERLQLSAFTWPLTVSHHATVLLIPRMLVGAPAHVTAAVLLNGRVQRTIHRRIAASQPFPRGFWRLPLSSPAIAAARARGAALVTVTVRAPGRLDYVYRARLQLRLSARRGRRRPRAARSARPARYPASAARPNAARSLTSSASIIAAISAGVTDHVPRS
jgi:Ca2+-binding RTX toxin-like protein